MDNKEKEKVRAALHEMGNDTFVGFVSGEETTNGWTLVFDKHIINISGDFKIDVEKR